MKHRLNLSAAIGALSIFAMTQTANAQVVTDEIVITAQKREQSVGDVPISVTAYSGEQLEALAIDNTVEITEQIPNLQVSAWSPNLTIFNIRGVSQNNFQDNLEAPVAVYVDNAYGASINALSGQLFDVERVEVLRGPQGTLFGRNATGGLIHYISNDASEEETSGHLKISGGSFDRLGIEGAIGGALNESGSVRIRASARYDQADGYIEAAAALPGVFEAGNQDLGGEDGFAFKINLQADITENLTGSFWFKQSEDSRVDTGGYVFDNCNAVAGTGFCSVNAAGIGNGDEGVTNGITGESASPFDNFNERPGVLDRESDTYQAEFDYSLDNGIEIKSITNFMTLDKLYQEDGDALPVQVLDFDTTVDFEQFSQEFRVSGDNGGLKWQAGAYYLDFEIDGSQFTVGAPILGNAFFLDGGVDDPSSQFDYVLDSKNWSVFGQAEYALTDKLNVTAGLRYSADDKDIDISATLFNGSFGDTLLVDSASLAAVDPDINEIDYNDWAGRLALDYTLSDNTLLFASVNRGIKGGNWTLTADVTPENFQHDEETLHSFETGFKTSLADNTLKINGTAFYYDYDDYQAFALTGGTPSVTNSDATSFGAEFEVYWSPTPSLDFIVGGAYLDTEVDEVNGPGEQVLPNLAGGIPTLFDGACNFVAEADIYVCDFSQDTVEDAEFPNAPELSFNYLARYNIDVAGGNLAAQVDGAWYDDQFLEVTNGRSSLQPAYHVGNASLSWTTAENEWTTSVFVKNWNDQEYRAYTLNLGALGTTSYFAPPRTWGASVKRSF